MYRDVSNQGLCYRNHAIESRVYRYKITGSTGSTKVKSLVRARFTPPAPSVRSGLYRCMIGCVCVAVCTCVWHLWSGNAARLARRRSGARVRVTHQTCHSCHEDEAHGMQSGKRCWWCQSIHVPAVAKAAAVIPRAEPVPIPPRGVPPLYGKWLSQPPYCLRL